MNYLAHILLSHPHDLEMLGNFLGDFVRNKDLEKMPETVQQGVRLHWKIDEFTDDHPSVKKTVEILKPALGRYASVASDILYDHFLCLNWEEYCDIDLREFCDHFYFILNKKEKLLPEKLKIRKNTMIRYDFLMSTADEFRLLKTMEHMERRTSFKSNFTATLDVLRENKVELEGQFRELFGDLKLVAEAK